jgi:hypothetical protein
MTSHENRNDRLLARVRASMGRTHLSNGGRHRIAAELERPAAGNTTLRDGPTSRWPVYAWGAAATAAAVVVAEILGRSQLALAAVSTGIERTTYDLEIGGALVQWLPVEQSGRFTVEETIDHDRTGRYRLLKRAADGSIAAGAADDPQTRTRTRYVRLGGRGYLLRLTDAPAGALSVAAARSVALRAMLGVMRTAPDAVVTPVVRGGEDAFEITAAQTGLPLPLVLHRARAVVRSADARLLEFEADGAFADEAFSVAFTLRNVETLPAGTADFTLEPVDGDEVTQVAAASPWAMLDLITRCVTR